MITLNFSLPLQIREKKFPIRWQKQASAHLRVFADKFLSSETLFQHLRHCVLFSSE